MTSIPTSKTTNEPAEPATTELAEENVSYLCRIHLKAEAAVSTLITLPILALVFGYKGLVYVIFNFVPFVEWLAATFVVPVATFIWNMTVLFFGVVAKILRFVLSRFGRLLRYIRYLFSIINWCAVRSLLRIGSMCAGIGSAAFIVIATIPIYQTTRIITGRFFDSDPTVFAIHAAIIALLVSVCVYYNAWVYSKPEEVSFVCRRTWSLSKIKDLMKR